MALNKKPSAPKAEPAAATKQAAAATEENRNADQPEVAVDEQGKAINTGDQNAAPATPAQPQSRDAVENAGEADEDQGTGEGDETPPVQDTLNGLPQSREAEENSEEVARLAAEKEAAEKAEREETQRQAAAQKELDEKAATEKAQEEADKALKEAAKGKPKTKTKESMVKVKNISSLPQRQWSTGIWLDAGETKAVKEDGWYRVNRDAKIIEDAE